MASPPRQALLRVVTGPHAGAELLLSEGPNTLGADDDCDIVLADIALAPRHALLTVSAGVVTVEQSADKPVYVDGQPVTKHQLRPYQVVTVGQTHVAIGPSSEPWPSLTLPTLVTPSAEPEPVTTETPPNSAPAATAVANSTRSQPVRRDRRRGVFAVVIAALVLLAFLLLWNPFGSTPVAATPADHGELKNQINAILAKFGDQSDLKLDDKAKQLTITGYVPNVEVRKELGAAIADVPAQVRITVAETAGLADAAARVMKMHKLDFTATPGKPGEVVVSGVTKDLAAWKKVKGKLASDVPKIRTLTDRVTTPNQPRPVAKVVPEPPPALITPPRAPEPAVEPSVETPAAEVAPVPQPAAVTLAIRSITIGQYRSLVLDSGERVFEGATLPGGYVVKSIAANAVVLDRMGEQSIVTVGASK